MSKGFDDGKDAGALRTIGEVGDALAIKPHVLRYWEQQFPMLEPLKRSGGRRYYRPEDIALVRRIDQLVNEEGYTIKGAIALLENDPSKGGSPKATQAEPLESASSQTAPDTSKSGIASDDLFANAAPSPSGATPRPNQAVPSEVVARLKNIRETLAAAISA
ncbi:MerR family transcriptional regulator [Tsuneonella flava]|uniref:MerR family transcriptional regulator n=1 Tax=Tsuneonella flava TaxID=2055955 RepID=A0ABX7K7Q2_9SPHN|nr:MerR family transcriptional regulator [Tsuneonella flava]QSB44289.1 MerR family transcriptional regulator [Tsuneonella flava]